MKRIPTFLALVIIVAAASCKKSKNDSGCEIAPSKNGSIMDLARDSVYLYAKEAYYWYDAIPSYCDFNPRAYSGTNDLEALEKEVNAISQLKINVATGKPYEYSAFSPGEAKYSFIDAGQTSTELGGAQSNFGFAPLYNDVNDLRIKYVYGSSAADLAGVKRGYRIISINGNSNLSYDGASGPHTQFVINAYAYSNTITMVLQKPDLSTLNVSITAAPYTTNPVLTYKVLTATNGHKVGYFVFNAFTTLENATPKLNEVFNYFAANGVTDLVVDLRYNGGGSVSTAEYLCNLIVPASKNNTLMYKTYYNNILTTGKASILANQVRRDETTGEVYNYAQLLNYLVANNTENFLKKGPLANMGTVFFIVGGGTASASELVINNLRPVLNVKIIGSNTYGKPVGFFDIKINKYEMFIAEFETKNSLGQGGYYTGMKPGTTEYPGKEDYDDVTHDFGDPNETLLKYALTYVNTGTFADNSLRVQGTSQQRKTFSIEQSVTAGQSLDVGKFSGMIYDKPPRKN